MTLAPDIERGYAVRPGAPLPLGASEHCGGVNFALFSRHATAVKLLLFEAPLDEIPYETIELDQAKHRTGDIWHVWLKGAGRGTIYAWRVDGPYQPEQGHRFNVNTVLLDPYAAALVGTDCWDFACACGFERGSATADRSFSREDNTHWQAKAWSVMVSS